MQQAAVGLSVGMAVCYIARTFYLKFKAAKAGTSDCGCAGECASCPQRAGNTPCAGDD